MELLEQCRKWSENGEYQKISEALERVPAGERTPEMDSELARAYIFIAETGEREPYEKALELLKQHEEYFASDHCWNYRIASAYYYLGEEGPALRYFEKALEARPGDEDTLEYINDCRRRLALPRFEKNFRERTEEVWAAFAGVEAELRAIMDTDDLRERGEEIMEKCGTALKTAFSSPAFEIGFNGEKYELILSAEGSRSGLFPLVCFRKQAPESVLEHWNILVGRQPSAEFSLRSGTDEVCPEDVQVWVEQQEDGRLSLALCCEKLLPLQQENEWRVWWMLSTLTDQVLGEINAIAHIGAFDLIADPKKGRGDSDSISLAELPGAMKNLGLTDYRDGADYLENSYLSYKLNPIEDPDADWRLDVCAGSARLPVLINEYMSIESDTMDEYHRDGIVDGFLCYPVNGFEGEDRAEQILQFRDNLQETIQKQTGENAVTFLGGATGIFYGYLDFIAWDLPAVLDAAEDFFAGSGVACGVFHVFRRDVGAVRLWEKETEPEVDQETGSLLSRKDMDILDSFDDGVSGYFGKMLLWLEDFIEQGVQEKKFTLDLAAGR